MNIGTVTSVNGIKIRLSFERWTHVTLSHPEFNSTDFSEIGVLKNPESVLQGDMGELLAISKPNGRKYWIG